jgi:hypothetical protein
VGYHRSVKLDTFTTELSLDGEEVSDSRFGFIFFSKGRLLSIYPTV